MSSGVFPPSSPPTHSIFSLAKKGVDVVPLNTNGGSCNVADVRFVIKFEDGSDEGRVGKVIVADLRNVVIWRL